VRSYFNKIRFKIRTDNKFKFPNAFKSRLFTYNRYTLTANKAEYICSEMTDPLINFMSNVPLDKPPNSIISEILISRITEKEFLFESKGCVPFHHTLRMCDSLEKKNNVLIEWPQNENMGNVLIDKYFEDKSQTNDNEYMQRTFERIQPFIEGSSELLIPLFGNYLKINQLSIKILDDRFNPIDSNRLLSNREEYKDTIDIILKLNKYRSLLNCVTSQGLAQGGLRLNGVCPIRDLLEQKKLRGYHWGHSGDLVYYKPILKRSGFLSFWEIIYLAEALENEGIKVKICYDEDKILMVVDFNRKIEKIYDE